VGAIEYYNVANHLDDLQRSAGSQFTHSAPVDDDSLMKDSRGMRHGGLSQCVDISTLMHACPAHCSDQGHDPDPISNPAPSLVGRGA